MLVPTRVAGRTLGLRGPDLARGPEVAHPCTRVVQDVPALISFHNLFHVSGIDRSFLEITGHLELAVAMI